MHSTSTTSKPTRKPTITTAYRQNNYLIVDNKYNSVTVSVYFQISKKNIIKPNVKSTIRSIKNSMHKYDKGQILVRNLTSDTNELPLKSQMNELVEYLSKYENLTDLPTFQILWKRLTDYQTLRHIEKSLLLIQYLLNQQPPLYSVSFEKYCIQRKQQFVKLSNYYYKIDGSDIAQNVRKRAANIHQILFQLESNDNINNNNDNNDQYEGEEEHDFIDIAEITSIPSDSDDDIKPQKKPKTKKKKKRKKKHKHKQKQTRNDNVDIDDAKTMDNQQIETEDLLSLENHHIVQGDNTNTFWNNNGNNNNNKDNVDIFDIFGELPPTQQTNNYQTNGNNGNNNDVFQDLLSSSSNITQQQQNSNNNIFDTTF